MPLKLKNFASSSLTTAIDSEQTTISVTDSVFPTLSADEYFYLTITPAGTTATENNTEIVKVTQVSGNVLSVVRGADGTTVKSFNSGATASITSNVANIQSVLDGFVPKYARNLKTPRTITFSGALSGTTVVDGSADMTVNTTVAGIPNSKIVETTTHSFITEAEKLIWDAKAENVIATSTNDGLVSAAQLEKINGIVSGGAVSSLPKATDIVSVTPVAPSDIYGHLEFNGRYYFFGRLGSVVSTTDARTWIVHTNVTSNTLVDASIHKGYMYISGNNATLIRSADGYTWESLTGPWKFNMRLESTETRLLATNDANSVYHSDDGGITWVTYTAGTTRVNDIHVSSTHTYISGEGGFFARLSHIENTWGVVSTGTTDQLSGMHVNGTNVLIKRPAGKVLVSNNSGASWSLKTPGTTYISGVTMSGTTITLLGDVTAVSTNNGNTWVSTNNVTPISSIGMQVQDNKYYICNSNIPLVSVDNGGSWIPYGYKGAQRVVGVVNILGIVISYGSVDTYPVVCNSNGNGLICYGETAYIPYIATMADGSTRSVGISVDNDLFSDIYSVGTRVYQKKSVLVGEYLYFINYKSNVFAVDVNTFKPITSFNSIVQPGYGVLYSEDVIMPYRSPNVYSVVRRKNIVVEVGDKSTIDISLNSGTTWAIGFPIPNRLYSVVDNGSVFVAVGQSNSVWRSLDALTWTATSVSETVVNQVIVLQDNSFLAVGDTGKVLRSIDGASWTTVSASTKSLRAAFEFGAELFVCGLGTVLRSNDGGTTWIEILGRSSTYMHAVLRVGNYTIVGSSDKLYVSVDGGMWDTVPVSAYELHALSDGRVLVFGAQGLFVYNTYDGSIHTFNNITFLGA